MRTKLERLEINCCGIILYNSPAFFSTDWEKLWKTVVKVADLRADIWSWFLQDIKYECAVLEGRIR
jgi:hypothetical protein